MAAIEADGQQIDGLAGAEPADGPFLVDGVLSAAGVARLLRELREQDRLRIGLDREIRCRALMLRLAGLGIRLDGAEVAADWLAPLLATSLPDQAAVRARLDRYFRVEKTHAGVPSVSGETIGPAIPGGDDVAPQVLRARNLMRWVLTIGGGCLAAVLGAALSGGRGGGGFGTGTGTGAEPVLKGVEILPELAFGLLIGAGVYVVLIALRRELGRSAVPGPAEGAARPSTIGIRQLGLFDSGVLRPALRALRDFRQPYGRLVDVAESIRVSVREGGIPHLVFGSRPKLPDYLVLAEQYGIADQFRLLQASLIGRLEEARVHFEPLTFGASPLVLRRWSQPRARPERLDQVIARAVGARLVLVTDGARLYSPAADALVPVMDKLDAFPHRVLLTPVGPANWGAREAAFERAGFVVMPLTPDGLAKVAAWLLSPEDVPPAVAERVVTAGGDLAHEINRTADRYMRQAALPPQTIATLLGNLKSWLGIPTFYVLAASAAQPHFDLELTIRLAYAFRGAGYRIDESSLGRLMRLPWMRRGAMPDWLRTELLRELPPEVRRLARSAYLGFYSELPISTGLLDPLDQSRMASAVTLRLTEENVAQDPLLVAFLDRGSSPVFRALVNWSPLALAVIAGALAAWQSAAIIGAIAVLVEVLRPLLLRMLPLGNALFQGFTLLMIILAFGWQWLAHRRSRTLARTLAVTYASTGLFFALVASSSLPADWGGALAMLGFSALIAAASPYVQTLGEVELRLPALLNTPPPFWGYARAGAFVLLFVVLCAPSRSLVEIIRDPSTESWVWIAIEIPALLAAALFAAVAARCARLQGVLSANAAVGFALLFVAAHGVAGVVVSPSALAFISGFSPFDIATAPGQPIMAEARLVLTGLLTWVLAGRRIPALNAWRVSIVVATAALVTSIVIATVVQQGIPTQFPAMVALFAGLVLGTMPWRMLLASGAPAWRARTWLDYVVLAKAPGALLVVFAVIVQMTSSRPMSHLTSPANLNLLGLALILPEWLLLLPFLRDQLAERRPNYRLWASALLLLPCGLGLSSMGPLAWASWPIALWLGTRFGTTALGPIALVLVPMLLVGLSLGVGEYRIGSLGSFGVFVGALLCARLGSSDEFRRKVLSASEVTAWQLAALLILFPLLLIDNRFNILRGVGLYPTLALVLILTGFARISLRKMFGWYAAAVAVGTLVLVGLGNRVDFVLYSLFGLDDLATGAIVLFGARWLAQSQPAWVPGQAGSTKMDTPPGASRFSRGDISPTWAVLIVAAAVVSGSLRYGFPTELLFGRSSSENLVLLQDAALVALYAAYAFRHPSSWTLPPLIAASVEMMKFFFRRDDTLFDIGSVRLTFSTGTNLPFDMLVTDASLRGIGTVLAVAIVTWAASRIARTGWHPSQERMERDGSLTPLFAAVWQDYLRALGLALFALATSIALNWWLKQWPLNALNTLDVIAPAAR